MTGLIPPPTIEPALPAPLPKVEVAPTPLVPLPKRKMGFRRWFTEIGWRHLVGLFAVAFSIFPLLYVVSVSINPVGTLTGSNELFRAFDPGNYLELFANPDIPFLAWLRNTLIIGVISAVCTVFLGAMAAYAFSRMRFVGRRVGLLGLLLVQMFPQFLAIVAIFLLMVTITDLWPQFGLGTHAGLILIYLGGALGVNTFLMYGFFNTIPTSIDEAAKIDGAGHARIFFTIILRLVSPILAVVGLLSFIFATGEFVIASVILTNPDSQTLAVGLYTFISQAQSKNWGVFAAGAVISAIPIVTLFLFLQKYIVSGLTAGSVK
jgi:arabinogalactan oligomer/maltooligosaccharide transport system permease protein